MAITIGWRSQQSGQEIQGYDSRGRDHRWSTDAGDWHPLSSLQKGSPIDEMCSLIQQCRREAQAHK
jgi:hypothetical protein